MDGEIISRPSAQVIATENPDNTSDSCYAFSAKQLQVIKAIKISLSSTAVLICLFAIVVIIALRQYRTFVHRLLVYLMVIAFLIGITAGLKVTPVHHNGRVVEVRHGLKPMCSAIGFAAQVFESQFLILCTWILVYLVSLVVFQYRANSKRHEIAGLVISLGLPLTFDWVPFIDNMYGLAGPWCWIRVSNQDCQVTTGVIYQFTLFYGPQGLLILASFVSFLVIAAISGKRSLGHSRERLHSQHSSYQQALKESLPLLVYPIFYSIISGVLFVSRYNYATSTAHGKPPNYPLWLAHTIADPLRILFIPLAYLLHPGTIRKLLTPGKTNLQGNNDSETNYPVSQEPFFSEVEPLVIRGSVIRHGNDYKSIFESSSASVQ